MKKSGTGLLPGLLSALLLFSGCVGPAWVTVNGPYTMSSQNYEVTLPEGWKRYDRSNDVLTATRDGTPLQQIRIMRYEIGEDKTPFTSTKKKIQEGMLPQEMAEIFLDDLRSNPKILNLQVQENSPATVDGHRGIKLVCTYQTATELHQSVEGYVFILGKYYYLLVYDAPARHYFERDRAAFEKTKDSFKLTKD